MKFYVAVLGIVCMALSACQKDRTCNCTVVTSGNNSVHSQTAGITLPIPGLPPVVLVQPTDTTVNTPFNFSNAEKTNYDKISKKAMRKSCPSGFEENSNDYWVVVTPGTSTVSTIKTEKKTYSCKIE